MTNITAIVNQKGGVGKTTTAANLIRNMMKISVDDIKSLLTNQRRLGILIVQ